MAKVRKAHQRVIRNPSNGAIKKRVNVKSCVPKPRKKK